MMSFESTPSSKKHRKSGTGANMKWRSQKKLEEENEIKAIPSNWPQNVRYTNRNLGMFKLPITTIKHMQISADGLLTNVEIKRITSENHPTFGQMGLFAKCFIEKHIILGEYTGNVQLQNQHPNSAFTAQSMSTVHSSLLSKVDSNSQSHGEHYKGILFEDAEQNIFVDIDAKEAGNEFRFVNDYRGVSTEPNVKFLSAPVAGEYRILVITIADISQGDELVADYGPDFWEQEEKEPEIQMMKPHQSRQLNFQESSN